MKCILELLGRSNLVLIGLHARHYINLTRRKRGMKDKTSGFGAKRFLTGASVVVGRKMGTRGSTGQGSHLSEN